MIEDLLEKSGVGGAVPRQPVGEKDKYHCPRCDEEQTKGLPHWCRYDERAGLD